jgi:2-methylcitrate dehydratase PrpD
MTVSHEVPLGRVQPPARPAANAACATITLSLAAFICAGQPSRRARAEAGLAMVDTLAATLAGTAETPARNLARALRAPAGGDSLPWITTGGAIEDAALLCGMASHMLDYDDVSMIATCHLSAPVLSALLATTSAKMAPGRSGSHFVEAYCVGAEVMIRLGEAMGFAHYELGFHATGTLGCVGAAAACARFSGLDETLTRHALAIAASLSCGLQKNFGTPVKALHVGFAAANGVRAVRLALGGVEGAVEAFDRNGFLRAFSGGEVDQWPARVKLGAPYAIESPGLERKRYPCCYMTHKIIEATLALARVHAIGLQDVAQATVALPPCGAKPLIHPRPATGIEAKFSAPYALLASLLDNRIDLASFADAAVRRPAIQARLGGVAVTENTSLGGAAHMGDAPVTVTLRLRDGCSLATTVTAPPGSAADPLTSAQLRAKWFDCLHARSPELSAADAAGLFEHAMSLEAADDCGRWLDRFESGLPALREANAG